MLSVASRAIRLCCPNTPIPYPTFSRCPICPILGKVSLRQVAMASGRPMWQQTMLRIKDPKVSVPYYRDLYNFTLVDEYHFEEMNFSLYFMALLPSGETYSLKPGSEEAHQWLWNTNLVTLELTHNHGSEKDENFSVNNGNVEPHRGFGHIAVNVPDVYAFCGDLEKKGVLFQKKPDDGRMKGIAFSLDPDGYWIEIVSQGENPTDKLPVIFSQTMIRVKDPKKSLDFYEKHFGMTRVRETHFDTFSLYFLASLEGDAKAAADAIEDKTTPEARTYMKNMSVPVLELTHNHGTEDQAEFSYHNGNTDLRGFGHLGFLVDDAGAKVEEVKEAGHPVQKGVNDGKIKGIGFVRDPDNYWVEVIPRGFSAKVD